MRSLRIVSVALAMLISAPSFAQEGWITYTSAEDRFALNLPGQPTVTEFTYMSEYGSPWRARRHEVQAGGFTHRMTVVDMSSASSDRVSHGFEMRGAMAHAAAELRKTGNVVLDTYDQVQVIPGHKLEIVLADGSMNIVELHIYDKLLYIQESISPADEIPGYDVQSSLELLNADLIVPRYENAGFPGPVPAASSERRTAPDLGDEDWIDYVNMDDRFAVALPRDPEVEEFVFESAQYSPWSARRYTSEENVHRYSMTVIDMTTSRLQPGVDAFRNTARPGSERSGGLAYAAWSIRKEGMVEVDSYVERQTIPGIRLEVALGGGQRKVAEIYEHQDFLYILEHVYPSGDDEELDVHATLQLLDAEGNVPVYVDDERTFPAFMEMTGDGTGAAGRDTGALVRGQIGQ